MLEIQKQRDTKQNILGHMLQNTRKFILQTTEMDHVYNAVLSLLAGKLSHFIVDHEQLQSALNWLQDYLTTHETGLIVLKTKLIIIIIMEHLRCSNIKII